MANKFEITITAVDKITATVDRINKRLDKMFAPVKKAQESVTRLTSTIAKNPIAKLITKIARATQFAYSGITALLNPFMALIGASSIAGVGALADRWGRLAYNIKLAARSMGLNPQTLQKFQGGMRWLHIDPDSATQELSGLGVNIANAMATGDQTVKSLLLKLGTHVKHTPTGEVDPLDFIHQLADEYQRNPQFKDYQLRARVNHALGLNVLAPALNNGGQGIDAAEAADQAVNPANTNSQLDARTGLYTSMTKLEESMSGLLGVISNDLVPPLTSIANYWSSEISRNRLKAHGIGDIFTGRIFDGLSELTGERARWAERFNNPTLALDLTTNRLKQFADPTSGLLYSAATIRQQILGGNNTLSKLMAFFDRDDPDHLLRDITDLSQITQTDPDAPLTDTASTIGTMVHGIATVRTQSDTLSQTDINNAVAAIEKIPVEVLLHVQVTGGTAKVTAKTGNAKIAHALEAQ